MSERIVKATLRRSAIGTNPRQRATLQGLGLTRVGRAVILKDSPAVRGMLATVAKFAIWTFIFGFIILWVTMIIIGTMIRGPGWMWFWPGMTWDHNRLIFEVNRDLDEIVGIKNAVVRIVFGGVMVAIYVVAAGYLIHRIITWTPFSRRIYSRMSLLQYVVMQTFLILMLSLPVKILLRLLYRIKYVWVTPWFNI